jgi:DNA-binding transcriptional LysR family regulator
MMDILPENANLTRQDVAFLVALINSGSVTRAADALSISQPQASKRLQRLRQLFTDPLVVRQGNALKPTARALQLYAKAELILAAFRDLARDDDVFDPSTAQRSFRILLTDVGMVTLAPRLANTLADRGPDLTLDVLPFDSRTVLQRLETGEADLAIGALPKAQPFLKQQTLYVSSYTGLARKRAVAQSLAGKRHALINVDHVLVTRAATGNSIHGELQDLLLTLVPKARLKLRVPSFTAAAVAASQSDLVTIVPTHLADVLAAPLGLATFNPNLGRPPLRIMQFWHERQHSDAAHKFLRSEVFRLFGRKS